MGDEVKDKQNEGTKDKKDKEFIQRGNFDALAQELKAAIAESACKCLHRARNEREHIRHVSTSVEPLQVDSSTESFYSAVCLDGANGMELKKTCQCIIDEIIRSFEEIKVSYGVFCTGQLPQLELDNKQIDKVEVERKNIDPNQNKERIKVRIRLNDHNTLQKTKAPVANENSDAKMTIKRSEKFTKSITDYKVIYETSQDTMVDPPRVVKNGDNIKIFIPLGMIEETGDEGAS